MWAACGAARRPCWQRPPSLQKPARAGSRSTSRSPVAMTANTVYVASYHSTGGHYSADWDYFSASGVDNAPRTNGYVTGIRFYKSAGNTGAHVGTGIRSEEHTSELPSLRHLVCRLLLETKKTRH